MGTYLYASCSEQGENFRTVIRSRCSRLLKICFLFFYCLYVPQVLSKTGKKKKKEKKEKERKKELLRRNFKQGGLVLGPLGLENCASLH